MTAPVLERVALNTGTVVEVWRASDLGLPQADGGPWVTVCEHGSTRRHERRSQAESWATAPEDWCETGCRAAAIEAVPF